MHSTRSMTFPNQIWSNSSIIFCQRKLHFSSMVGIDFRVQCPNWLKESLITFETSLYDTEINLILKVSDICCNSSLSGISHSILIMSFFCGYFLESIWHICLIHVINDSVHFFLTGCREMLYHFLICWEQIISQV
jgi:hypothetical protein